MNFFPGADPNSVRARIYGLCTTKDCFRAGWKEGICAGCYAESIGDTSWIDRDGTMSHRTAAQKAEVLRHIGPGESWGMWQAIQEASPDILGSLSCDEIKNLARWLKDNDHYQPSKARWAEDQTQGRKYNEAQVRAYWAKQQAE